MHTRSMHTAAGTEHERTFCTKTMWISSSSSQSLLRQRSGSLRCHGTRVRWVRGGYARGWCACPCASGM